MIDCVFFFFPGFCVGWLGGWVGVGVVVWFIGCFLGWLYAPGVMFAGDAAGGGLCCVAGCSVGSSVQIEWLVGSIFVCFWLIGF